MKDPRLIELCREQRAARTALKASVARSRRIATNALGLKSNAAVQGHLLLRMTEALIAAHMAAKVDDDGYTLDLIEDALRHVGRRLAAETPQGRSFGNSKPNAIE